MSDFDKTELSLLGALVGAKLIDLEAKWEIARQDERLKTPQEFLEREIPKYTQVQRKITEAISEVQS